MLPVNRVNALLGLVNHAATVSVVPDYIASCADAAPGRASRSARAVPQEADPGRGRTAVMGAGLVRGESPAMDAVSRRCDLPVPQAIYLRDFRS